MGLYAVKMDIKAPLHIGEVGMGMEEAAKFIHSDTLYSAICWAWSELYSINGKLPLEITSAFPYVGEEYFLPRPGLKAPGFEKKEIRDTYAKLVKKTKFIRWAEFQKWIAGERLDFSGVEGTNTLLDQALAYRVRPRVSLDRITQGSNFYQIGEVIFARNAGLYFLLKCEEALWPKVKGALRFLGDSGIGGKKSNGYGRFEPYFKDNFSIPGPDEGEKYVTLSLVLPINPEEVQKAENYQLIRRGGWGQHGVNKELHMFAEGAVFSEKVEGKVVDVGLDGENIVYRNGRAFLVGVNSS